MGKKGVLLDNGKQARSSMALFWNNAQNNKNKDKNTKHEAPQEDMQTRAASNLQKWKLHKEKLINKLYQKPEKTSQQDAQAEKQKQKKLQEQMERQLLQKHLNKNKPVSIPGFKNANHLKSKLQYEQVKQADNSNNVLKPRAPGEELTHEEIVQILREKKAKKDLERAHKQQVEENLRQRQQQNMDLLMDSFPQQKLPPQPKPVEQQQPVQKQPQVPQTYFKSQLLQKIQRGQHISSKPKQQQVVVSQQKHSNQPHKQKEAAFVPKFIPRAMWHK